MEESLHFFAKLTAYHYNISDFLKSQNRYQNEILFFNVHRLSTSRRIVAALVSVCSIFTTFQPKLASRFIAFSNAWKKNPL